LKQLGLAGCSTLRALRLFFAAFAVKSFFDCTENYQDTLTAKGAENLREVRNETESGDTDYIFLAGNGGFKGSDWRKGVSHTHPLSRSSASFIQRSNGGSQTSVSGPDSVMANFGGGALDKLTMSLGSMLISWEANFRVLQPEMNPESHMVAGQR
jgi:hypothetical protein